MAMNSFPHEPSRIERMEARDQLSKQILMRLALVGFIIFSLVVASGIFLRQQDEMRRVSKRAEELQEQLEILEAESNRIDERSEAIRSVEELENIARNELGMVKPGEIIYKDAQDRVNR